MNNQKSTEAVIEAGGYNSQALYILIKFKRVDVFNYPSHDRNMI